MKLPEEFLQSIEGVEGFEKEAFVRVHEQSEGMTSIRINLLKISTGDKKSIVELTASAKDILPFLHDSTPVPWCSTGFYLSQRPSFTFDPFFHAGLYYVQEASSMFLEQAFRQLTEPTEPLKVLDLCASPGGKSTHIQSLLSEQSLLVSNEVIRQRSYVLADNIIKWGCQNVIVSNNDPKAFQKLPGYFDVLVVDAPCSGSGLFRKDEEAIKEWSINNVQLCSQRQQRILADALPALKTGGLLVYSTCSYSEEEDEQIADWLVQEMGMENVALELKDDVGIVKTSSPKTGAAGYRFFPDKIKGEGFFMACFRKTEEENPVIWKPLKAESANAKEKSIIQEWIKLDAISLLRFKEEIIALPENLLQEFLSLQRVLTIQYAGVRVGNILKEKLVPHHALAQNTLLLENIPATELNYEEAIRYLQRQDISITSEKTGWQVVRFKNKNLGWINALKNRVNNYYPKEIRILKQQNNAAFGK